VGYTAASTSIGTGVSGIDLTTASSSQDALTTLDLAIDTITDSRAAMGAYQNRLTASIANLETTSMNLSASRSRILDTDYAKETTNLAKSQIIQQAATAMLAQANQSGQSVLALLK
jgi:flagellin